MELNVESESLVSTKSPRNARCFGQRCHMFGPALMLGFFAFTLLTISGIRMLAFSRLKNANHITVLISLDGFRADYITRGLTPALELLASDGVSLDYLQPSFPTITFPNHYTIATGLHVESHGIIANTFKNTDGKVFTYTNDTLTNDAIWWKGEPIWKTVMKNGFKSANYFWPGSNAPQHLATYSERPFNLSITPAMKFEQALRWMGLDVSERPKFIAVYIPEIDHAGHEFGPNSKQVDNALENLNNDIQKFLDSLRASQMLEFTNLVFVSDHGMQEMVPENIIYLDTIADVTQFDFFSNGPVGLIYTHADTDVESLFNSLRIISEANHFKVWIRENVPPHYYYSDSDRISEIVILMDSEWIMSLNSKNWVPKGMHGFDPEVIDMQALFVASGPGFRKGTKLGDMLSGLKMMHNVEVYGLLCDLMEIVASPHNGTIET